jgi:hypothetical protein
MQFMHNPIKGDNTMELKPLASNMTEVEVLGARILFSYKTPVAALVKEGETWHQYKTDKKWSATTSRHITKWNPLGGAYGLKPQEFFDSLLDHVQYKELNNSEVKYHGN